MKKYEVRAFRSVGGGFFVEASNKIEAEAIVLRRLEKEEMFDDPTGIVRNILSITEVKDGKQTQPKDPGKADDIPF